MTEKNFRKKVISFLKDLGETEVTPIEGAAIGVSDLLVNYKGRFVAIELKGSTSTMGKKNYYNETEAQKLYIHKQVKVGGMGFVLKHTENWRNEILDYLSGRKTYVNDLNEWWKDD